MKANSSRAVVVGAGPNGLAAAIVLAQAGMQVEVFEAEKQAGGGARTLELTLPGFHHDFGSAVHPMAAASPFFTSLPLHAHGLEWIHSPAPLAHPFDDGSAITLEHDLEAAVQVLAPDGKAWRELVAPLVEHWAEFAHEILRPLIHLPRNPFLMASFGLNALLPATSLANRLFRSHRTKALFAGLAAHSFLALNEPMSAAFGIVLGTTAHAVGWPIPRGGAQSITRALIAHLSQLGGTLQTSSRVNRLDSLGQFSAALCDVTPRQLLQLAGERFTPEYNRLLGRYRYGPGVFKVDYALSQPIPWKAPDCARAATVHLGGNLEEFVASEDAMRHGRHAERPFVLLSQPTLFDLTRAPQGKHIVWAYCHVPNGSSFDMLPRLEAQIERFAPGFCECILSRRAFQSADLEAMDANLVGGDINGGAADWRQFLFRPTWRQYATPDRSVYICSSSTPPGGGVHGMCGFNAANLALSRLQEPR
jgi:phytoene dehydrogenase-like protein